MNLQTNEEDNQEKAIATRPTEAANDATNAKEESFLVHTLHQIEDSLKNINADFPLSGGETEEDFQRVEKAH